MRCVYLLSAAIPGVLAAQQPAPATPPPAPQAAPVPAPSPTPSATPSAAPATPPATGTAAPSQAAAQTTPAAEPTEPGSEPEEPDIIVRGQRNLPGSVIGDIPPDEQLGPADIRSYGVSSIGDLLTELGPLTQSGVGGAPVVLVDGKRISGIQEISNYPTEAIARIDILPEEVALKYGYRADQKVINVVLRRRFLATTVELSDRVPTDGGTNTPRLEHDLLEIRRGRRLNLHSQYQQSSALTESERDIALATTDSATGQTPVDQRPFRTLLPFSRQFGTNAVYARPFGSTSATFNGSIQANQSRGQSGLAGGVIGGDVLNSANNAITGHLGTTLNRRIGESWNSSLTAAYDRVHSTTRAENSSFVNRGVSDTSTGQADLLLAGPVVPVPAGKLFTSVRLGATTTDFSSRSIRAAGLQTGQVSRDEVNGRINVDLPIASRTKGVLGAIGNLSLNANAGFNRVSDFRTLTDTGYGVNWSPLTGVRMIASISNTADAPSAQQLGNPTIVTPNVRVFDYVLGQTATVTSVSGGNPGLRSYSRRVSRVGLTLTPWSKTDLTLTAGYTQTRSDDPIQSFPAATAALEAAFPDRFTRVNGILTRIDTRPVNIAYSEKSEVRWGLFFSKPLKSKIQRELEAFRSGTGPNPFAGLRLPGERQRSPGEGQRSPGEGNDAPPRDAGDRSPREDSSGNPPPRSADGGNNSFSGSGGGDRAGGGGFRGGGGGRGFGGGRGGGGGGRMQFGLFHTIALTDRALIASGLPRLDALNGDVLGSGSGTSRHQVEGQAGYNNNGVGARLTVNYASGTRVKGGTIRTPDPLDFSALTTADLRLWLDFSQRLDWVKAHPWLRGARLSLTVDNILNTRQRVTDATGATPVSYQPDYRDKLGRTLLFTIRKQFY